MRNMHAVAEVIAQAEFLLRQLGETSLALEHAQWALEQSEKADTKSFWIRVMKEIKQLDKYRLI